MEDVKNFTNKVSSLLESLHVPMFSFFKENKGLNEDEMFTIISETISFFLLQISLSIFHDDGDNICMEKYLTAITKRALEIKDTIDHDKNNHTH